MGGRRRGGEEKREEVGITRGGWGDRLVRMRSGGEVGRQGKERWGGRDKEMWGDRKIKRW